MGRLTETGNRPSIHKLTDDRWNSGYPRMDSDVPLYGNTRYTLGVGYSNVGDLLRLTPEKVVAVQARYGQRVNGIPTDGRKMGMLVGDFSRVGSVNLQELAGKGVEAARAQAAYTGALAGDENLITVYTPADLRRELASGKTVMLDPYVNNATFQDRLSKERLTDPNLLVNGLDPRLVERLKEKAKFHNDVKAARDPEFAVPHHEVAQLTEVTASARDMLAFEEELYTEVGLPQYPRGVVFRLDYSDGGFGGCRVVQDERGVKLVTDENSKKPTYFGSNWAAAFTEAQKFLSTASDQPNSSKVIVSRFLDITSSPGISLHFIDGEPISFGFNGQIMDPETGACVGTYSLTDFSKDQEQRAIDGSKRFVYGLAHQEGIDPTQLQGGINFDWMIHGPQEMLVQEAIVARMKQGTLSSGLKKKLDQYGQLPEVIGESLAECNPRTTNARGAYNNIMVANGMPQTPASINEIIRNGMRAEDKVAIPDNVGLDALREELLTKYTPERRAGGLTILRMVPVTEPGPDEKRTIGVIYTGDASRRRAELHDIFTRIGKR